jgi:hypothetical protein
VDAHAGFLRHSASRLRVQIRQIAERSNRQKVAFKIFNARLDNALFSRVCRRTRIDLESISFGALRIRALHERIAAAGSSDRALRIIDDQSQRHLAEPLERASMQAEPRRDALIEDELDILVTRKTQRHDKCPSPTQRLMRRIEQIRTRAEIHLSGLGGRKVKTYGCRRRNAGVDVGEHPPH